MVTHNQRLYEANWCTTSEPGAEDRELSSWGTWKDLGACTGTPPKNTDLPSSTTSGSMFPSRDDSSMCSSPEWKNDKVYCNGETVSHNEHLYVATYCTIDEPGTENLSWAAWVDQGLCSTSSGNDPYSKYNTISSSTTPGGSSRRSIPCFYDEWAPGKQYCSYEMVTHNQRTYEAKWCTTIEPGTEDPWWGSWEDLGSCAVTRAQSSSMWSRLNVYKRFAGFVEKRVARAFVNK